MSDWGGETLLFFYSLKLLQYHIIITSIPYLLYIRLYFALCWYLVGIKV